MGPEKQVWILSRNPYNWGSNNLESTAQTSMLVQAVPFSTGPRMYPGLMTTSSNFSSSADIILSKTIS